MLWTLSLSCLRCPIFVDTAKMGHLCDFQKKLHSSRRRYRDRDIKEPNTSKCVYKIVSHRWDEKVKKLFRKPINLRGSDGTGRGACPNSQRRRLASPSSHAKMHSGRRFRLRQPDTAHESHQSHEAGNVLAKSRGGVSGG